MTNWADGGQQINTGFFAFFSFSRESGNRKMFGRSRKLLIQHIYILHCLRLRETQIHCLVHSVESTLVYWSIL